MATATRSSYINFRGRPFRLFQRDGIWCVRVQADFQRKTKSLETSLLSEAKERAPSIIAAILDRKWDQVREIVSPRSREQMPLANLGEVFDVFQTAEVGGNPSTRARVVALVVNIVSRVKGYGAERFPIRSARVRMLPVSVLDGDLVQRFIKDMQPAETRAGAVLTANTNINSMLRQARSLFSARMVRVYQERGLNLGDINGFMEKREILKEPSHHYVPIPREMLRTMIGALPELKKDDERSWAIITMALLLGMRRSEIMRARKEWLTHQRIPGHAELAYVIAITNRDKDAAIKSRPRALRVPDELRDYFAKRGEWLIPRKNETDIINAVHRANAWLRRYLPDRTKALHELRKEFGSQIYAATGSLSAAAEALGDTLETARAHYLTQLQPTKALSLASLLS